MSSGGCRTTISENPDMKSNTSCVFPFKFEGVTSTGCDPWPWLQDDKGEYRRVCSTKVDAEGSHLRGQGEFGFCSDNCPVQGELR